VPNREDRLTYACRADIVRRCHELVLAQPEQPLSVMGLCASLRVSRRTIQNSFQSVTQMNPVAYLRAVRLAHVRRLLTSTAQNDMPVREAALRWGFSNLGHFASDYKSQFGELPSQTARAR
jgi:AraC family ethanolamine operon transcriptional activator